MRYSIDFRKKVMSVKASEGLSYRATASRFGVSLATVYSWSKRLEAKKPGPVKGRGYKLDMEQLRADVLADSEAYYAERAARFGVAPSTIYYAMRRLGFTKKNVAASES